MKTSKKNFIWAVIIAVPVIIASCKKSDPAPPEKPTISTNAVTNITANTATSGGFIGDSSNRYRILGRGIVYSSLGDPGLATVLTSQTYDLLNTPSYWGNYPSNMVGLTPNTTYYVRAYLGYEPVATSSSNMLYGELRSFKTLP